MERRIQTVVGKALFCGTSRLKTAHIHKKRILRILAQGILCALVLPQLVGAQHTRQDERIRIQIWSELEPLPGVFGDETFVPVVPQNVSHADSREDSGIENEKIIGLGKNQPKDESPFSYAIARAKEIAPFLVAGMIDGWSFEYVPSDSTRRVSEYFSFSEVRSFDETVNTLLYKEPLVTDSRLLCWVECERTEVQQHSYAQWESIANPKVKGHGTAPVSSGFTGIQSACAAAIKDAVREYWRINSRNKPKEIVGTVLLIQSPRIYIYEGQYIVDLDFFLKTDRITLYSYY